MASKVLVVDDEPYMHRLLRYHFERAGFQLLNAYNGLEAIQLAGQNLPSLIVMDVMMAEMDGLTALKQLKQTDQTKAIPVIMITANAYHVTRQEAESAGAALFLTKPFSPTQLLMAARQLVPVAPAS